MADRNPLLKPSGSADVQFSPQVLDQKITNAVNSIPVATGGTGSIVNATVVSYSLTTNKGNATLLIGGTSVAYTNSTNVYLQPGDVVSLMPDSSGVYFAIGLVSRAGSITPTGIPPVTLNTSYPVQTDSSVLTYGIQGQASLFEFHQTFTVDPTGNFGYNTNALYGYPAALTSVSGLNMVSATNFSLGSVANFTGSTSNRLLFVNPSGIMFAWDRINTTHNMSYRNKTGGSFTSIMTNYAPGGVMTVAYDDSNGALWYEYVNNTFNKWFDGDSTSSTVSLTGNTAVTRLVAGNGYLFGLAGTTLYRKASNDTADWTVHFTGTLPTGLFYAAGADGKLYITYESGGTIRVDRVAFNSIETFNTGIDGTLGSGYVRPMGLVVSSSNVAYFTCVQRGDILGGGSSSQWGIGLYATNFTTTSKLAYDTSMYQSVNVTFTYSNGLQLKGSNLYWLHGNQGSGVTTTYKIYSYAI